MSMPLPPGAGEAPMPAATPPPAPAAAAPVPISNVPVQTVPPPQGPPTVADDPTSAVPATPAPIAPDAKLSERQPPEQIKNPFERTAAMVVSSAEDYAKRLAGSLSEQPADTMPADSTTVHEMMNFSRYGQAAPEMFWQVHDQILQEAVAAGDPNPYAAAERGALDEVYPYRAQLALLDILGPQERVDRAETLMRINHAHIAKGNPPEALPFVTGPAGLPHGGPASA